MPNSHQYSGFANSFMRGYSFVDEIRNRREAQKKLDARLEEEKAHRAYQRERQDESDARVSTLFDQQQEAYAKSLEDTDRARIGDIMAQKPGATVDDLIEFVDVSAQAAKRVDELRRRNEKGLHSGIVFDELARGNSPPATGATTRQATNAPTRQAANATAGAPPTQGGLSAGVNEITGTSMLQPTKGDSRLQYTRPDELLGDPKKSRGFFEKAGDAVEDIASRPIDTLSALVENVGQSVGRATKDFFTGSESLPAKAVTGTPTGVVAEGLIAIDADYVSPEEAEAIVDPAERENAARRNGEIITALRERGQDAFSPIFGAAKVSKLQALKLGSQEEIKAAFEAEALVKSKYEKFNDLDEPSGLRSMAKDDPVAASISYFNDRATLDDADPELRALMDKQFAPVFVQAMKDSHEEVRTLERGTPKYRHALRNLRDMQVTVNKIYDEYDPSKDAGINNAGLPFGNSKLVGQLAETVAAPDRPRPATPASQAQLKAAGTVVSRAGNSKRGSPRLMKSALVLLDYDMITNEDYISLGQTGQLPKTSAAWKMMNVAPGNILVGLDPTTGQTKVIARNPKEAKEGDPIAPNEVNSEILKQFENGVKRYWPGDDRGSREMRTRLTRFLLKETDWIEERFNLKDAIAGERLAEIFASAADIERLENIPFIPAWAGDEQPTAEEIIKAPFMAARLAAEWGIPLKFAQTEPLNNFQIQNLRQELQRPGVYPPELEYAGKHYDNAKLEDYVRRYDTITTGQ